MPHITAENAAELARKSHEAKRAKAARVLAETNEALRKQVADDSTDFTAKRLTRVRAQLDRLDALAFEEDDPKRLKEYADATSRLQEQERQLANRPLPGTLKPTAAPSKRTQRVFPQPIEVTPSVPNTTSNGSSPASSDASTPQST